MPEFISAKVAALKDLFGGTYRFELPWFQRAYAWNTEEVGRLLTHTSDAAEASPRPSPYYLGTLVISKDPASPRTALIDGQQRIMTLTILFAVLRDLESDSALKNEIQDLIAGDALRFIPQPGCAEFAARYVQAMGGTLIAFEGDREELNDAESNILDNRDHLIEQIEIRGMSLAARRRLLAYLKESCQVVLHDFSDSEDAWRWLQREEETQHRFNATDKAKTSLTLAMPAADRQWCGAKWDEFEILLGPEDLFELLGHLRMLKRRRVSARPLEAEIIQSFDLRAGGRAFMESVLGTAVVRLDAIRRSDAQASGLSSASLVAIDKTSWIDRQIWVPAALLWLDKRATSDGTDLFFRRLERLVWIMRLSGMDGAKKQDRILKLLSEIEEGRPVEASRSLAIEASLRDCSRRALLSDTFDRKNFARPVLRLASAAAGDDLSALDTARITVEHVLPKGRRAAGDWDAAFNMRAARGLAHRLGNLTLLSLEDNHGLANKSWSIKRKVYAGSEFSLSRDLAREEVWTPQAIIDRSAELTERLFAYWELKS